MDHESSRAASSKGKRFNNNEAAIFGAKRKNKERFARANERVTIALAEMSRDESLSYQQHIFHLSSLNKHIHN